MNRPALAMILLAALGLFGCQQHDPPRLPTVPVQIGSRTFHLELAKTDADRQTGLMNRDSMPMDHGMIFVFADEARRSFWMKNTRIPLDILYLDAAGRVVDIKSMQPLDLRGTPSAAPAKYAIELNLGASTLAGVKLGDVIALPPEARQPAD